MYEILGKTVKNTLSGYEGVARAVNTRTGTVVMPSSQKGGPQPKCPQPPRSNLR